MSNLYNITIDGGRVAELFHAGTAPEGAVPISDEDGEMLRRSGRFADFTVSAEGVIDHDPLPVLPTVPDYTEAVQRHLDAAAQAQGYDGILSAASYAAVAGPFQIEGTSFAVWRSACWAHCYAVLAEVQGGQRAQPTVAELLAELPVRGA